LCTWALRIDDQLEQLRAELDRERKQHNQKAVQLRAMVRKLDAEKQRKKNHQQSFKELAKQLENRKRAALQYLERAESADSESRSQVQSLRSQVQSKEAKCQQLREHCALTEESEEWFISKFIEVNDELKLLRTDHESLLRNAHQND
jgi:chromosome segregation ATPase